jgi:hypothetical protein
VLTNPNVGIHTETATVDVGLYGFKVIIVDITALDKRSELNSSAQSAPTESPIKTIVTRSLIPLHLAASNIAIAWALTIPVA